jgi:hypothetical protein
MHKLKQLLKETIKFLELSKEAAQWIKRWSWTTMPKDVPDNIRNDLKAYVPKKAVIAYRGVKHGDEINEPKKVLKSYTYALGMAESIAGVGDNYSPEEVIAPGAVYKRLLEPDEIIADFNMLPKAMQGNVIDEILIKEISVPVPNRKLGVKLPYDKEGNRIEGMKY